MKLSFFLFLGHFELKLIECPQRHYAFPKFNSCLHCIRNVLIQQKLMRSFKYLDSLFCYLGKHFKDILESAIINKLPQLFFRLVCTLLHQNYPLLYLSLPDFPLQFSFTMLASTIIYGYPATLHLSVRNHGIFLSTFCN